MCCSSDQRALAKKISAQLFSFPNFPLAWRIVSQALFGLSTAISADLLSGDTAVCRKNPCVQEHNLQQGSTDIHFYFFCYPTPYLSLPLPSTSWNPGSFLRFSLYTTLCSYLCSSSSVISSPSVFSICRVKQQPFMNINRNLFFFLSFYTLQCKLEQLSYEERL